MKHHKRIRMLLLAIGLGLSAQGLLAQGQFPLKVPNGFTWGELALLPEYCKDTQGTLWALRGSGGPMAPDTPRWVAAMGEGFFAAHHYCYGLRNILRADIAGIRSREGRFLLIKALDEFRYMFRNASPTMPLMPEIYLKEGETHLKLGNMAEASASFEQSRRLKPDYWPAYTRWADALIGLKLNDRAKALLLEGLQHAPGEPELIRRLTSLGVNVASLPAQRAPAAAPAAAPADAASAPASASSAATN